MIRMIRGAFAALLLVASPALAQDLGAQMDAVINTSTATDQEIDAVLTEDLQAAVALAAGVEEDQLATLTDQQLADALKAVLTSNPNLTSKQVTALVRATVRSRPSAAAIIAGAAASARPDLAAAITTAAVNLVPELAAEIVQAVADALIDPPTFGEEGQQDNASAS